MAIRVITRTWALLLNLFTGGGIVLSLIAAEKAFLLLIEAFNASTSDPFSSYPSAVSSSSSSSFDVSAPLWENKPAD